MMIDLLVIGGGINGVGIANDAAGRGLSVTLVEQGDLAQATSSNSSKLIHGGLRYLEHYEFRLVHEALKEREVLLAKAGHIAWPLRFRLPHQRNGRPAWLVRIGLFLYDHLGKRVSLPSTRSWKSHDDLLLAHARSGFEYSDLWVDDARLVTLNAIQAADHGAHIRTRTRFVEARANDDGWVVSISGPNGDETLHARAVVNAAGPWVDQVFRGLDGQSPHPARLVKGSHIVVPKLYDDERAYILPNDDGRVVFVLPWLDDFSLIGTTDIEIHGDPGAARCSDDERDYLLAAVARFFTNAPSADDVVWDYAGVRPLMDDGDGSAQKVTRDYRLILDRSRAPLLSVHGGKLTTYRTLAEKAVDKLAEVFPAMGPQWTQTATLPGAEGLDVDALQAELMTLGLDARLARRLVRGYGTIARDIVGTGIDSMGEHFGAGLYEAEVRHMCHQEWARSLDDVLYRRSKMGLFLSESERQRVAQWLAAEVG
ncbi:glycerol-3-phosphate dehydrogenase [Litorivicinus lipolyticus]|uniref:glycerol-3-phosphate dehydrogenase n=1 Tax=Litorivicinus lipolyticus TaxID=418701 RepID=UPI003B5CD814